MIEPHHVYLLEMIASRPGATQADEFAWLNAWTARDVERLQDYLDDAPPADATARHLAEMRAGREVRP